MHPSRIRQLARTTALVAAIGGIGSCTQPLTPQQELRGRWGAERLELTADTNGARIVMTCASARLAGPIILGDDQDFAGQAALIHTAAGSRPDSLRVEGRLSGDWLRLTLIINRGQPFVRMLRYGQKGDFAGYVCLD